MEHELKIWPEYFQKVWDGEKTFELRKNDRDYKVGDTLVLREWDAKTKDYTGRGIVMVITYLLASAPHFGLMEGYCIMGIKPKKEAQ